MILGDPNGKPASAGIGGRATLDDLFRRAVARRPDAIALIDPPNCRRVTDVAARSLTYAQADHVISALAGRLHRIGLRSDAIIGLQLANSVECVLTFLAVLRAGMIAMPLPLLWRRADITAALSRAGASALIVNGRVGGYDQFDDALQAAAETFHIRFVCGFGNDVPDGVVALSDLFTAETLDPLPPAEEHPYPPGAAAHLAVITWDVGADGPIPVARSHAELATGGLAVLLEGRLRQDATILTTLTMSSFAGLATALLPWLLVGGTLALHHPFDPPTFAEQQRSMGLDTVVLPGPLTAQLTDAGALAVGSGLNSIIAPTVASGSTHAWHLYVMRFDERDAIADRLAASGVASAVHYPTPPFRQDAYSEFAARSSEWPISDRLANSVLSIPMGPHLDLQDAEQVAEAVRLAVKG